LLAAENGAVFVQYEVETCFISMYLFLLGCVKMTIFLYSGFIYNFFLFFAKIKIFFSLFVCLLLIILIF